MPQCIYSCNQASIRVLVVILLHNIVKLAAEWWGRDAFFISMCVMSVIAPLNALDLLNGLKQELPVYLAAAAKAPAFKTRRRWPTTLRPS